MIVKKPRNINFKELAGSMQKQVEALIVLQKNLQEDKEILQNKSEKTKKDETELANITLLLEEVNHDFTAKQAVLQEYMERTVMQSMIDKRDKDDYLKNNKTVLKAAKLLKNDLFVSIDLKNHLREILSVNTANFNEEQKISWFLALKAEVTICKTYRANHQKPLN